MANLKINNIPEDVLTNLDVIWKQKGYKSRDAFLREMLDKLVRTYWKMDEDLEQILVTKTLKVIELNTAVLQKVLDEKGVMDPFNVQAESE
ncbi:hypothetical protein HB837_14585 [Listeria innocua]|uniref:hypothetical protein n=1 Tax=Listeria innocua TaxID=1642 RepID=UPI001623A9D1|nr:hypothetical protein [Listeria innocua]MBC1339423.1 hypothetical protein [Listeria innocua]MBC1353663.1 hypothetical protein [Listeria innocua]